MPKNVDFINPSALSQPRGYSHVAKVKSGQPIYISGQIAVDKNGQLVGAGDLHAQTVQVFENIKAALEAADATFADVVKLTFFCKDISQMLIVREVRDSYINTQEPPASSAVEISRLVREELLIEIEAVAVVES